MNSPVPDVSDIAARIVANTMVLAVESCFKLPKKQRTLSGVMRVLDVHRRILRGIGPARS